jgi:hypothetical protein
MRVNRYVSLWVKWYFTSGPFYSVWCFTWDVFVTQGNCEAHLSFCKQDVTNTPQAKYQRKIVKRICHFVSQMILYLGPLLQCRISAKKDVTSESIFNFGCMVCRLYNLCSLCSLCIEIVYNLEALSQLRPGQWTLFADGGAVHCVHFIIQYMNWV